MSVYAYMVKGVCNIYVRVCVPCMCACVCEFNCLFVCLIYLSKQFTEYIELEDRSMQNLNRS